jgi:hypothetical protein
MQAENPVADAAPATASPKSSDDVIVKILWTYKGQVLRGPWYIPGSKIRHGHGVCTYVNGRMYEGEWKDDQKSGQGVCTWPSGSRYEGEWKDGKQSGQGLYTFPNGQWCEGEWKDDKLAGHGVYSWSDGKRYEGEWKDDKKSGQGVYTWPDGTRYEGEWKDDRKSGQGVYAWPSGMRYEGGFQDDKRSGRGVLWLPGGRVFDGTFAEGFPQQGTAMETGGALFHAACGKELLGAASLNTAGYTPAGRVAGGPPPQGGNGSLAVAWRARVELPGGTVVEGMFRGLRPHGPATLVEGGGAAYAVEYDGVRTLAEGAEPLHKEVRTSAARAVSSGPSRLTILWRPGVRDSSLILSSNPLRSPCTGYPLSPVVDSETQWVSY